MTPQRANQRIRPTPEYTSKPDPSQPWRWVCPDCGGQVHGDTTAVTEPYRCTRCGNYHAKDALEDKKR